MPDHKKPPCQLIVDFPEIREQRIVRISSTSTMFIEFRTEEDKSKKWTSAEDNRRFRQNLRRDVMDMRRRVESNPESISQEELWQCLGMESLLSNELVRNSFEQRMMHRQAVLAEQRRQLLLHIHDEEELCRVSEIHSQWGRERCFKIAAGYSMIKN